MKVTLGQRENNLVEVNIEVDAEAASQEYNRACRTIGNNVSIPGFRKGKAPRSVVEKFAGVERIQKTALDSLLPKIFAETISENDFDIVTEPMIEEFSFEVGQPLSVKAKLELKPEVKLKGYKNLEVEIEQFKLDEDAIEKEFKILAERFSTLEPVINRPVSEKDIVFIDFDGSIEGNAIKGGAGKNYQLDIANSNFISGFAEQLVGHSLSEEFTIDVTFPEEYHDAAIAGKPAQFKIKINEIKEKNVPEINDELAQKVGPFQTVDDLKADIEKFLNKTVENENKIRSQRAVLDKIIEDTEVDIPDSMVNREARVILEEMQQRVKQQGLSWEQVVESQGHEALWANIREEGQKRVKNSLVLGEIAKVEEIKVTDEDFNEQVKSLAEMYKTDESSVYKHMAQTPSIAQSLTQQILAKKLTDFLESNNKVKLV